MPRSAGPVVGRSVAGPGSCCTLDETHAQDASRLGRAGAALGVMASACCTIPLMLAAVGLGGFSAATGLVRFAPVAGAVAMAGLLFLHARRRLGGDFRLGALWRLQASIVPAGLVFIAVWALMTYGARSALNAVLSVQAGERGAVQVAQGTPFLGEARVRLRIEGMYCPGCIGAVKARFTRLRGVTFADVWMGGALVRYDPTVVSQDRIREAATFYRFEARIESDSIGPPSGR